jgi:transcriptional regulator with XRE-family HTH domain
MQMEDKSNLHRSQEISAPTRIEFAQVSRKGLGAVLAQRIRELVKRGTAARISAEAGISAETFSLWRTGARYPNPDLKELERIAEALGVSPLHLISEEVGPDGRLPPSADERAELDRLRELERRVRAASDLISKG